MKEYHAIVASGAAQLESVMKKTAMAERVYVFAIHGAGNGPSGYGRIVALPDSAGYPTKEQAPNGYTCVRPNHCDRWEGVAYINYHAALYEACRSVSLF